MIMASIGFWVWGMGAGGVMGMGLSLIRVTFFGYFVSLKGRDPGKIA